MFRPTVRSAALLPLRWLTPLTLLLLCGCLERITEVYEPPARPNIIVVMTDDQELGSETYMPRVMADLAARGTRFENYFITTPLCCPSRATFLTGRYSHNHGVLNNTVATGGGFETFYANGNEARTIAVWLQSAGYATALVGKYLNQYPGTMPSRYIPPGWADWRASVFGEKYYNYSLNENGMIVRYNADTADYQVDVLRRHALEFIGRSHALGQPFFLLVTPMAPHQPQTPAPRHVGRFAGMPAPRSPNFDEADVSDKVPPINALPPLHPIDIQMIDEEYASRLATLQSVDEMIGAMVDSLRSYGILENTYIVYTSDNGYHLGSHRLTMGKQQAFTEDINVPLIIRGPGIPSGRTVGALALNNDLAPTIGEWAGAVVPRSVDGRSLARAAQGVEEAGWRRSFLSELVGRFAQLRTAEYAYVRHNNGSREYYDIIRDPYQLENIYGTLSAARIRALDAATVALTRCAAASCEALEQQAP